ncbi:aldehyde dehydrogenase family protein [Verminephrobacter eiseniae]|uniref:aldehyde dehydrogenase family protein n=1 Tax=Verminephrobacter eiseniae TaxID=364317 RepID=UPI0022373A4D|nr:aldehyde dehydrogenase family protein [Verminephrobacter eiseniae]MCW5232125.1 aldehyde dehydrogenase family protein [Verminephrobacter eiseniae]MCW5296312.1 aldehyde dehydrogenase family protein [Verminephrobacter eiseniae]MCW8184074.1 aldehyde dehydrogenase family protein [Verminephrobacter eiseniae]MCW8222607.1 aldehyde dehydrogenase family protein [Verminephrobacter eiseniae]MCW8232994.1 aldehyde dehydrogenase family protein [Verminephrobacter eiseniae]
MTTVTDILRTMDYGPCLEAAAPVHSWLDAHAHSFRHFIHGEFVAPAQNEYFEVFNPATEERLARVAHGSDADIDQAVAAARQALPAWSGLSGHQRARYLYAIARHLQKHARFFAVLETMDNGKTIRESRDIDIPLVVRHFYHHAGWAQLLDSEFPAHQAVGVCGQIVPWNFPLLMLAWKVAPALAAGNTVVLKPAEFTPLTALAFAELCVEVGLPAGVLNIVTGDGHTGASLVNHAGVDKIAFTGSTEVGRLIRRATAGTDKKLSLELGGKSPFIVFDDADLDAAVEGVVDSIWFNQGQVCCAGSRILVQESVAARFGDKLRARMRKLRIGNPLDKSNDVGAIVDRVQLQRIRQMVESGRADGLSCWQTALDAPSSGHFFAPTFFEDVPAAHALAQEEIFGPVVISMGFRTLDEAVALANHSRYGLAASLWSENIDVCLTVAAQLAAGVVWVNGANMFDAAAGFGGYRESGFGREGGREGMHEYLVPKWLHAPGAQQAQDAPVQVAAHLAPTEAGAARSIDRSAKFYIGGKQVRPDSGYSFGVRSGSGALLGHAGFGNRKDIRNAVETARKAGNWSQASGHARAQVLYYFAENLGARAQTFIAHLQAIDGISEAAASQQFEQVLARVFHYAAMADKHDGSVHSTLTAHVTLAMNEPFGVVGVRSPANTPLLAALSLALPLLATGNRVVLVPPPDASLMFADLHQVLDTSDVPAGVLNIVWGDSDELAEVLALHDDVDALWYFGPAAGATRVQAASAGNLKSTWVQRRQLDWTSREQGQGGEFMRHATQVKNVWIPYGE